MAPKAQTSGNSGKMGRKCAPLHPIAELTSFLQGQIAAAAKRGSMHRRWASDTLTTVVKRPFFAEQGSSEGSTKGKAFDLNDEICEDSAKTRAQAHSKKKGPAFDPGVEAKRMKRLLAKRVSAQKWRQKRQDYIEKLTRDAYINQAKVAMLAPKVALYESERGALLRENIVLKQRIMILAQESAAKTAAYEELKKERDFYYLLHSNGMEKEQCSSHMFELRDPNIQQNLSTQTCSFLNFNGLF